MTQEDFLQIESSQRQHFEVLEHQERYNTIIEASEMNLFKLLSPKFGIDGNQYYVLYGDDLQSGVAGFGDTLYLAILDFNKSFHKPITKTR